MMLVYRISSVQYVQDLSGTGAKINGARWNQVNYPAVYTAENRSLAALEILVHSDMESIMAKKMEIISIEIPDEPSLFIEFEERNLEADWERNELYTQGLGTHLLSNQKILAFKSAQCDHSRRKEHNNQSIACCHGPCENHRVKAICI